MPKFQFKFNRFLTTLANASGQLNLFKFSMRSTTSITACVPQQAKSIIRGIKSHTESARITIASKPGTDARNPTLCNRMLMLLMLLMLGFIVSSPSVVVIVSHLVNSLPRVTVFVSHCDVIDQGLSHLQIKIPYMQMQNSMFLTILFSISPQLSSR